MKKIITMVFAFLIVSGCKVGLYAQTQVKTDTCTETHKINIPIHPDALKSIDTLEKYVKICEEKSSELVKIFETYDKIPSNGVIYEKWKKLTLEYLTARTKASFILGYRNQSIIQGELNFAKEQDNRSEMQKLRNEIVQKRKLQERLDTANNNILNCET